ncbi:hypothetical protein [Saccharothrix xinjiangensis]|uniref:Membrane protein YqaA with SNARE-associated domain n=1 Tax=Saccharothrix xinjiangensis TaxID=204798 RepID=A0ABV9Y1W1_9PSEU
MVGGLVLGTLLAVAGIAFGSAVVPLVSIELVVVAVSAKLPDHVWAAVAAAAVGQVAGKSLYLLAAGSRIRLPRALRERIGGALGPTEPGATPRTALAGRWQRLRTRCEDNRRVLLATLAVSALAGLPPIMLTTVLAGLAGVRLVTYLAICLPLRLARFAVLATAPGLLPGWLG